MIGAVYLVGACLLLPGFRWIIPDDVVTLKIPVHFDPVTHVPDKFANLYNVPVFSAKYGDGVRVLIVGVTCILTAAVIDLAAVHCREAKAMGTKGVLRLGGPILQVLGAAAILWGVIVFLPSNQGLLWNGKMDPAAHGPVEMFNMKAPDFGNLLFKIGAVLYFLGAILALVGVAHGIKAARQAGRDTSALFLSIPAFCLFMCTSTMFFINGCMPGSQAVQAGWLRMAAAICLFLAVCILCVVTGLEIRGMRSRAKSQVDLGDALTSLSEQSPVHAA